MAAERDAEGQPDQGREPGQQPGRVARPRRWRTGGRLRHAARAATRPRPAARASPPSTSSDEPDQHQRQGARRGRGVEAHLELGEDLGGEGPVAQDLEGPVLGQQGQGHQQAAAEDGQPGLAHGDPPEGGAAGPGPGCGPPPPAPGRRWRRLAATGRYTSGYTARVMTRTAPQKPPSPGTERRPAEGDDEVGDAQRHDHQHRPDPAAGQVGALEHQAARVPMTRAGRGDHDGQAAPCSTAGAPSAAGRARPDWSTTPAVRASSRRKTRAGEQHGHGGAGRTRSTGAGTVAPGRRGGGRRVRSDQVRSAPAARAGATGAGGRLTGRPVRAARPPGGVDRRRARRRAGPP